MIKCKQGRVIVSMELEQYRRNAQHKYGDDPLPLSDKLWDVYAIGQGVTNFDSTFPVQVGSKVLVNVSYSETGRFVANGKVFNITKPDGIVGLDCA